MKELIRDTYNTFFQIYKSGMLQSCDPELAGLLAKYVLTEPDFLLALNITYDFYKKFRDRNPATEDFWDDIIQESGTLYEMTGENQMVKDILLYLVNRFERQAKTTRGWKEFHDLAENMGGKR